MALLFMASMKITPNISLLTGIALYACLSAALMFAADKLIFTEAFISRSLQAYDSLLAHNMQGFDSVRGWSYFLSAIYLFFKFVFISLCLYAGFYVAGHGVSFRHIFRAVVFADFIFLLPALIKIIWFSGFAPDATLQSWQAFYPLSILSLLGDVPVEYHYPLQLLNAFELADWILIAVLLSRYTGKSFDFCLRALLFSYVPVLVCWCTTAVFYASIVSKHF